MKARHLVWIRRVSQTLFLLLFLVLLMESRLPQDAYLAFSQVASTDVDLRLADVDAVTAASEMPAVEQTVQALLEKVMGSLGQP